MRIVAYLVMAVAALTLLPFLMMAPMSLMAFDSGFNPAAVLMVGGLFCYPIWLIYWLRKAWALQTAGDASAAIVRALTGAAPMLLLIAVITLGSAKH